MADYPRVRSLDPQQLPNGPGEQVSFLLRDPAKLSTNELVVSLPVLFLLEEADGSKSLADIASKLSAHGIHLEEDDICEVLDTLDQQCLLDNEKARKALAEINPRPMRHHACYPKEKSALQAYLDRLVGADQAVAQGFTRASILPHIDFFRGEVAYREGYRRLHQLWTESSKTLTVVVLGISHAYSRTPFILTEKDFATPLGVLETDRDLVRQLAQGLPFDPFQDEYNHMAEHSIEFHATLLKHLARERDIRLVPILCSSFFRAIKGNFNPLELAGVSEFVERLKAIRDQGPGVHFLASVDLAHMGTDFGGAALTPNFLEELRERDLESLRAVCEGDSLSFFSTHQRDGGERNYCGTPAIFTLLELFPQAFELHEYLQCSGTDRGSTVSVCSATLQG